MIIIIIYWLYDYMITRTAIEKDTEKKDFTACGLNV